MFSSVSRRSAPSFAPRSFHQHQVSALDELGDKGRGLVYRGKKSCALGRQSCCWTAPFTVSSAWPLTPTTQSIFSFAASCPVSRCKRANQFPIPAFLPPQGCAAENSACSLKASPLPKSQRIGVVAVVYERESRGRSAITCRASHLPATLERLSARRPLLLPRRSPQPAPQVNLQCYGVPASSAQAAHCAIGDTNSNREPSAPRSSMFSARKSAPAPKPNVSTLPLAISANRATRGSSALSTATGSVPARPSISSRLASAISSTEAKNSR